MTPQSHSPEEKRQDGYVIHKDGSMYPIEPYNSDEHEYPKMLYHKDGRTVKVADAGQEEDMAHQGFLSHSEMCEEDPANRHKSFHTAKNAPASPSTSASSPSSDSSSSPSPSPKLGKFKEKEPVAS